MHEAKERVLLLAGGPPMKKFLLNQLAQPV